MPDLQSFEGWPALLEIPAVSVLIFGGMLASIRAFGKRSLSKLNVFDFVVTIAMGSILSATILTPEVTVWMGLGACLLLLAFQYLVVMVGRASPRLQRLFFLQPRLLYYRGNFVENVLREVKLTEHEIHAAVRQSGRSSLAGVRAIVFEADGTLSVIAEHDAPDEKMLEDLEADLLEAKSA